MWILNDYLNVMIIKHDVKIIFFILVNNIYSQSMINKINLIFQ